MGLIARIFTSTLIVLLVAALSYSLTSGKWSQSSAISKVYKTVYFMSICQGSNPCKLYAFTNVWQTTMQALVIAMLVILLINILFNIIAAFFISMRYTRVFAILYGVSGILGVVVLIIFPIKVEVPGTTFGYLQTWMSNGYYTFMGAVFLMFTLIGQCYYMNYQRYPKFLPDPPPSEIEITTMTSNIDQQQTDLEDL
ncbi:uncharacterized protein LOC106067198 isoform X1 [Biomphalaria glabrata]|uniref:Uncharacterized protein LOC106067198 isoform X1 n=3 Tax=Biomphalaria glabrata TaxID=6526 RepID=A0A9W2YY12_BIOGL|nr:uncharacterized protein LOC106067198 isoform X1 [Biomphalaria glabrata]XP_055867628.1 uncharacterized protein LOC106067198 isoform X1 [Biomphalaria glabrata]KAI8779877.1 hypothetical protein BgiBS90_019071 [Biomphalaria glabrata]